MRATNVTSFCLLLFAYFVLPFFLYLPHANATTAEGGGGAWGRDGRVVAVRDGPTVRKDERWPLVSTEFGEIAAVKISNGKNNGCYYLHFITLEPHSLFLPVQLFSEMVLYVNSGNGTLSLIEVEKDDYELRHIMLQRGDIYRLHAQTVFYLQNNLESEDPQKLQIYAIFSDSVNELQNKQLVEVYAGIHDLVLGFDNKVLQATLSVTEEVMGELRGGERQPLIVQEQPRANNSMVEVDSRVIRAFLGTKYYDIFDIENKKKKDKKKKDKKKKEKKKKHKKDKDETSAYSILKAEHDVENDQGWSVTVTSEHLDAFKESHFGVFMVNLTGGSLMGPQWNPTSAEIAIVLHGQGVVQVVCPSIVSEMVCQNSRFRVEEGDVFVVPQYHPTAHISLDNESFVFMGFTMTTMNNPTQYLAGENSILQTLDKTVLEKSFNVTNTTIMDQVLSAKNASIILECKSCANEEEKMREEDIIGSEREGDGGGKRWEKAVIEGEIARREEEEFRRRLKIPEEAATAARGKGVTEKCGCCGRDIQ